MIFGQLDMNSCKTCFSGCMGSTEDVLAGPVSGPFRVYAVSPGEQRHGPISIEDICGYTGPRAVGRTFKCPGVFEEKRFNWGAKSFDKKLFRTGVKQGAAEGFNYLSCMSREIFEILKLFTGGILSRIKNRYGGLQ